MFSLILFTLILYWFLPVYDCINHKSIVWKDYFMRVGIFFIIALIQFWDIFDICVMQFSADATKCTWYVLRVRYSRTHITETSSIRYSRNFGGGWGLHNTWSYINYEALHTILIPAHAHVFLRCDTNIPKTIFIFPQISKAKYMMFAHSCLNIYCACASDVLGCPQMAQNWEIINNWFILSSGFPFVLPNATIKS